MIGLLAPGGANPSNKPGPPPVAPTRRRDGSNSCGIGLQAGEAVVPEGTLFGAASALTHGYQLDGNTAIG